MTKTEQFTQKLKDIYGANFSSILKTHESKKPFTFFININQYKPEQVLQELNTEGYKVIEAGLPNSYISTSEKKLSESKAFLENKIYIQQLSSMLPVLALDPKKDEKILDLCASPGSKTILMSCFTKKESEIIAVEKSRDRFFKLNRLLENFGADNVRTLNVDAKLLPHKFTEFLNYFDKVLVDAPCSNEVNIDLNNKNWHQFWRSSNAKNYSKLQKGLLNAAVQLCKSGGEIVYSTCTYSAEENEKVLDWILKKNKKCKVQKVKFEIQNQIPALTLFGKDKFDDSISKAVRILPNENYTGFFVAKLKKD